MSKENDNIVVRYDLPKNWSQTLKCWMENNLHRPMSVKRNSRTENFLWTFEGERVPRMAL